MAIQRRQILFLVRFAVLSIIFYIPITIPALSRVTVEPFTRGLTSASAAVLNMLGQQVQTAGTIIRGGGFGVDIKNGCNAVEAVAFLAAAVLAFEAPLKLRIVGAIVVGAPQDDAVDDPGRGAAQRRVHQRHRRPEDHRRSDGDRIAAKVML